MLNKLMNLFRKKYSLSEVFISNGIPKFTFVQRPEIDKKLSNWISLKNKVCFFLGYSKSGKTVYRKKWLEKTPSQTIIYRCTRESKILDLYNQIIIESNSAFNSKTSQTKTNTVEGGFNSGSAHTKGIVTKQSLEEKTYPVQKLDVNYICNQIKDKKIVIVLEDYHLINKEFNIKFSEDIKHFIDESILFLIIGIPSSPGRSFQLNPDLTGRAERILFDYLSNEQIKEIIKKGSTLLRIELNEEVVEKIINFSMRNAFLVQSILYHLCLAKNIQTTQEDKFSSFVSKDVERACNNLADDLHQEYKQIIESILSGIRTQKKGKAFNQYEEIIKSIRQTPIEKLEEGILHTEIAKNAWSSFDNKKIKKYTTNDTYQSEASFRNAVQSQITSALNQISKNLNKVSAREIILYKDNKLYLMDIVFKFYLTWKPDLLEKKHDA